MIVMEEKKKKTLLTLLILLALIILVGIGGSFAYFTASVSSEKDAVNVKAAVFEIDLEDDISLIKDNIIPSAEKYVDIASKRQDENGNFLKPTVDTDGKTITKGTTCIDDNLNEICSIYTFTIINKMTDSDVPLYITINPNVNTFKNLYFKVLDQDLNEVIPATLLVDDREYTTDSEGNTIYNTDSKISPIVLSNINKTLNRATSLDNPSKVTYSIVMWIMETNEIQNDYDGGKIFASTLNVKASGANGQGITGVISATGTE